MKGEKRQTGFWNPKSELASREELRQLQLRKLQTTAEWAYARSPFWRRKLDAAGVRPGDIRSLDDIRRLPFLTKQEWVKGQEDEPLYGDYPAAPPEVAIRYHQTSGTSGRTPLRVLDGRKDWEWVAEMWAYGIYGFGVRSNDIAYVPFSYGIFIGFWGAHNALEKMGVLTIPGGGQSTEVRVNQILELGATVIVATPTYALRLAQVAGQMGIDLARDSKVELLIHAGEPGANIPSTKQAIQDAWGGRAGDFPGMTECGTIFAFECNEQPGAIHIIEDHFIEEVIDPDSGEPVGYGERGERVMTSFGRGIMPVLRYRTSDLVEKIEASSCPCGRTFDLYQGGIIGRIDEMKIIRGVNVYPSAVENIVRGYHEVNEFQILITKTGHLDEIKILVEPTQDTDSGTYGNLAARLASELANAHEGLRFVIEVVEPATLPTFELKARRLKDMRGA
ncbi:MAG: phenylacetate--CoA ligase family protein [Dehalococcoidia bacterium]|nr:phenylacetate--CoA ligase family protein [Dehalococcoidia bacterium]